MRKREKKIIELDKEVKEMDDKVKNLEKDKEEKVSWLVTSLCCYIAMASYNVIHMFRNRNVLSFRSN